MLNKGHVHQPDKSKVPAMKSRTLIRLRAIIMLYIRLISNNVKGLQHVIGTLCVHIIFIVF